MIETLKIIKSEYIYLASLAFLILLVSIACGDTSQSDFGSSSSEPNGWLLVSSDNDGDYEIFQVNLTKNTALRLTDNMVYDQGAVVSPDGERFAFASEFDKGQLTEIVVLADAYEDAVGTPLEDLKKMQTGEVEEISGDRDIFISDPETDAFIRITDNTAHDEQLSWSPDGTKLVFSTEIDFEYELVISDLNGDVITQLTDSSKYPGENLNWHPSWSPDGTEIIFSSNFKKGDFDIYKIRLDEPENIIQLTNLFSSVEWTPTWSPDGTEIIFSGNRGESWDIYIMDANGENLRQLTSFEGSEIFPTWSPDGNWIAFGGDQNDRMEVFIMRKDGTDTRRIGWSGFPTDWSFTSPFKADPESSQP